MDVGASIEAWRSNSFDVIFAQRGYDSPWSLYNVLKFGDNVNANLPRYTMLVFSIQSLALVLFCSTSLTRDTALSAHPKEAWYPNPPWP